MKNKNPNEIKKYKNKKYPKKQNKKSKVLVVVPAYNEAQNIEKVIKDLKQNTNFDYIIINDSSSDNTQNVCKKNNFNVVNLPINYGLTSVIQFGMKYAKKYNYDILVQFDGDGQHMAKYLNDLVKDLKIDEIRIGSRFLNQKKELNPRMIGSNFISFLIKLTTGKKIKDPTSGFRAYGKKAIDLFCINPSLTPEPDTLVYMIKKKLNINEIQVEMRKREFGQSYLNFAKSLSYMANMTFSIVFLRNLTIKKLDKGGIK